MASSVSAEAREPWPCKHWIRTRGKCAFGDKCAYPHPPLDDANNANHIAEAKVDRFGRVVPGKPGNLPLCKHWRRTFGNCVQAERCPFQHPPVTLADGDALTQWLLKQKMPKNNGDYRNSDNNGRRFRRGRTVRNRDKSGVLRRFILERFGGPEGLRQGAGVLDVAGGNAELSWQLVNLNAVASTVCDPRAPSPNVLARLERRWQRGFYDRNAVFKELNTPANIIPESTRGRRPSDGVEADTADLQKAQLSEQCVYKFDGENGSDGKGATVPHQSLRHITPAAHPVRLRSWFNSELWTSLLDDGLSCKERGAFFVRARSIADELEWGSQGLTNINDENAQTRDTGYCQKSSDIMARAMDREHSVEGWEHAAHLLRDCSIIVGLHPDQATSDIVEFALRYKKPFAIVPCCVFWKANQDRKTPDGRQVRTYDDFLEFLQAKRPSIRRDFLDIEGRNTVLYWHPSFDLDAE